MRCRSRGRPFFMPLLLGLALALRCQTAWTFDASEYLFLPTVTQGEREVDWHFGVGSTGATTRQAADAGIGIGMGVTAHWYTELDLQYRQRGASGTALDAVEWENILQLAEPNQWPIDVGVVCAIERPQDVNERPSIRIKLQFTVRPSFSQLLLSGHRDRIPKPDQVSLQRALRVWTAGFRHYGIEAPDLERIIRASAPHRPRRTRPLFAAPRAINFLQRRFSGGSDRPLARPLGPRATRI